MNSLRGTAERCAQGLPIVSGPSEQVPPPGADEAVRVMTADRDAIWARRGDFVVVSTSGTRPDPSLAPVLATKAIAKIARGTS